MFTCRKGARLQNISQKVNLRPQKVSKALTFVSLFVRTIQKILFVYVDIRFFNVERLFLLVDMEVFIISKLLT